MAELLRRWKSLLIITLVFTVLAAGLAMTRGSGNSGKDSGAGSEPLDLEAEIKALREEKRGMITDAEARDVERVFSQYRSYIDFRNMYQEELVNYNKSYDKSGEDMLIKRVNYRLTSSLVGADTHFTAYSLDIEDYKKIAKILPDVESISAAYKHVYFGAVSSPVTVLRNPGTTSADYPAEYEITVEMLGNTRDVCDKIWKVIEKAFQRKLEELKKADPETRLDMLNTNYRGNIYDYYIAKEQSVFDNIQKIDTTINNIRNQYIDKFTDEQKAYYQALENPQRGLITKGRISIEGLNEGKENVKTAPRFLNKKTMVVLGMLAGLFLAVLYVLAGYLTSGTIKINREIQDCYQIPVLATFFMPGKEWSPFSGLVRRLVRADSIGPEIKADMIAADACSAVRREGGDALYIVQPGNDDGDQQIASIIRKAVESCEPAFRVSTGAPLTNVEELRSLAQEKNVLLIIHNKKTLKADVEKLLDFCSRHSIRVLGTANIVYAG